MTVTKRIYSICHYLNSIKMCDIGTDHCLLPIYAIKEGRTLSAIGADVNEGPLNCAHENVAREGLLDKIELRLGDGFTPIAPYECDSAVISGMGGMLIAHIIERGLPTARTLNQLILSPQSDHAHLRRSLHKFGFEIYEEDMVRDGNKFYPIIIARPCALDTVSNYTDFEYEFGKLMLESPNDDFYEYLQELVRKNKNIIDKNPLKNDRKSEILKIINFIEQFCESDKK